MAQKNPFLKYIMKDKREDIFHSSAYAREQSGSNIGAASTESYAVRVNMARHRQTVGGYRDSRLMTGMKRGIAKAEGGAKKPGISPGISIKK